MWTSCQELPGAFGDLIQQGSDIDGPYLDGIVMAHGSPRQHIWSFGHLEFTKGQTEDATISRFDFLMIYNLWHTIIQG